MAVFRSILPLVVLVHSVNGLSCTSCNKTLCREPVNCRDGLVKGVCGCCDVCAKGKGERCGGPWNIEGKCANGLKCVTRTRRKKNVFLPEYFHTGICEPDACEQKKCGFRETCKMNKRGRPVCICPRRCGKGRRPVCGLLNGKQYRNRCKLAREECLTKEVIGLLPGPCKKCALRGREYKFGDARPDVEPCEICICRHGSWECQIKPNCSRNSIPNNPKPRNGRPSCFMSSDGRHIVLPCPKDFSCRMSRSDQAANVVRIGVCKKRIFRKPERPRLLEIVNDLTSVLSKEKDVVRENVATAYKTSEYYIVTQVLPTNRGTNVKPTLAKPVETLRKRQKMGKGGLMQHVCLAEPNKENCRPLPLNRWFYNATSRTCDPFQYGGCGGSFNNFVSKSKCEEVCNSELIRQSLSPVPEGPSFPLSLNANHREKPGGGEFLGMCHDMKSGTSYRDGEKWNLDECTSCSCTSGRALCVAATCHVTCSKPIHVDGKCCPICESDLEYSGKTVVGKETRCRDTKTGVWYHSGESWDRNKCMHCVCFEGETSCMESVCTKPLCDHPVEKDGVCCPVCPEKEGQANSTTAHVTAKCEDKDHGKFYKPGDAWKVNDCISCFCNKEGQSLCQQQNCLEPKCANPVHLQGRCCPVCPESFLSACTYDNQQYFKGDFILLGDMCTLCKCKGNAWNCTEKHCNETENEVLSTSGVKLEKFNSGKQHPTMSTQSESPKVNLDDSKTDHVENSEFVIEDPLRMSRRGTGKPMTQLELMNGNTDATNNEEFSEKYKHETSLKKTSSVVYTLPYGNSQSGKITSTKSHPESKDELHSTPQTPPFVSEYRTWTFPPHNGDSDTGSHSKNNTIVYRTKRL